MSPPIGINGFNDVALTTTSTGYLAEVTPPSGQTAQGMADALSPPGLEATAQALVTTVTGLRSDLNVQSINICVAAAGAGCGPYPPPSPPSSPIQSETESSGAAAAGGAGAAALAMATACAVVVLRGAW